MTTTPQSMTSESGNPVVDSRLYVVSAATRARRRHHSVLLERHVREVIDEERRNAVVQVVDIAAAVAERDHSVANLGEVVDRPDVCCLQFVDELRATVPMSWPKNTHA